jgi:hypothetical protein
VERLEQRRTIAHDLLEVVLCAQFLPEIKVFLLQPCLQAVNFLVGLHILNRQCDLVRHFLQEFGVDPVQKASLPIAMTTANAILLWVHVDRRRITLTFRDESLQP